MLLEFKTENFKSFLDEMDFLMTPAPKQKDLEYSILEHKIGKKLIKDCVQQLFMDLMHQVKQILFVQWMYLKKLY